MNVILIDNENDLERAFAIRKEVFVDEQHCPVEDEFDSFDQLEADCDHLLVTLNGEAVGTGRIRYVENVGKLERICICKAYRAKGIGKVIVKGLEDVARQKGVAAAKLHGQQHAEGFYHRLGYKTASEVFIEDGIPHLLMKKEM
ncbi:GNAT family N-acetyltransferase [Shouchella shacheensis]|uniref:GNAT family N-acetyltransferase n=1 Tax=Shouchella shacheensis TaxID=1649580 RepID=UPI000740130A|nr:GNAT family N-acetyltransferase [Shouchella shacheensis]